MKMVYLVTGSEFLKTYILGAFSTREEAEKQIKRIEDALKKQYVICMTKFEVIEVPFDSTEWIDKSLEQSLKAIK